MNRNRAQLRAAGRARIFLKGLRPLEPRNHRSLQKPYDTPHVRQESSGSEGAPDEEEVAMPPE